MKHFKIQKFTLIFLLPLFFFTIAKEAIFAQELSLLLTPPITEIITKSNQTIDLKYQIVNERDPTNLLIKVLPFEVNDNLGNIKINQEFQGPIRFSLQNNNLELDKLFFLRSKEVKNVTLQVRIPEGTPEGDYYYAVSLQTEPSSFKDEPFTIKAQSILTSNLLITVTNSGNVEAKGQIVLFDVLAKYQFNFRGKTIKIFDSGEKIPVVLIFENKGRNLFKPYGEIRLNGLFANKTLYKIIPQNILSQSQRLLLANQTIDAQCAKANLKTNHLCKIPASLSISKFLLGKYSLTTKLGINNNASYLEAATTFIVLPLKIILIIFVFVPLVFLLKKIKNKI